MVRKKFPKLKSRVVLAPMHNITNVAFRVLCKKYGASMVSTELLSANALARGNSAVEKLALNDKSEKPVVGQIFGQKIENVVKAGKFLESQGFDLIDFNLGCPSKKIMGQGSGGALLRRPGKVGEIVKALVDVVKIPVTVKIRSGIDGRNRAVEIAKICESSGASAVIVHARSVEQGYSGKADWNVIKEVKEAVKIPVIGNGDVWNGENAKRMIDETGCDYVMIGRGAIGNPFVFKSVKMFLDKEKMIEQSSSEKVEDYFNYIKLCKKFGIFSVVDAKLKAQEFTKGLKGSVELRRELNKVKSFEEIERLMKGLV
ncbi:tRNA dihydrouridine synthase DusB [archaeon]|nr:tRNA dihydrouridine synthase DusB [archaeon]